MSERIQIGTLELTGPLAERFQEATERLDRKPTDLTRLIIREWLDAWESKGKPGWQSPLTAPGPSPPTRPKSGERAAIRKGSR